LFNDPWDCKPHFNTEVLNDPAERQKLAEWAIDLCQCKSPTPQEAQERMRQTFLHNPAADFTTERFIGFTVYVATTLSQS